MSANFDDISASIASRSKQSIKVSTDFQIPKNMSHDLPMPGMTTKPTSNNVISSMRNDVSISGSTKLYSPLPTKFNPVKIDELLVIRNHYCKLIFRDLQELQIHARTSSASIYACSIMKNMRQMQRKLGLQDPYIRIISALHDAMVFNDRWADYDAEQYKQAYDLLEHAKLQRVDESSIKKSLHKLCTIGFDILPFEIEWSIEDE